MWGLRRAQSLLTRKPLYRVGWLTFESFQLEKRRLSQLRPFGRMRAGFVLEWINANSATFYNELYHPGRRYDIVVFLKVMDKRCQAELQRIQAYGGKTIFDANVNYYKIWGDYFIPGTRPTDEEQHDAIWMTRHADWVVADSSYLAGIARKFASHVTWIPDNVDLDLFRGIKQHSPKNPVVLVWSGISKKASHLLMIQNALAQVENIELVLVSAQEPEDIDAVKNAAPCRFVPFRLDSYARLLGDCDIIISPKRLCNAYALGHTEYKISQGMAVGLPVVASPQQSYIEAISHNQGGIIAETEQEWAEALNRLVADHQLRSDMGARARQTVLERYSTPVVARQYLGVFTHVLEG